MASNHDWDMLTDPRLGDPLADIEPWMLPTKRMTMEDAIEFNVRTIYETEMGYSVAFIRRWLEEHEYDGLFRAEGNDTCGCSLDDLCPCDGGPHGDCIPAYRHNDGLMYLEPEEEKP